MKICLFLQRTFSGWGHLLVRELKKMGVEEFCAYTYPLSSAEFLRQQKDITYSSLLVDEEVIKNYKDEVIDYVYLEQMEKKYGDPNLLRYVFMDRFIMTEYPQKNYSQKMSYSYEDSLKILQLRLKAITKFLEEEKPDLVIFSAVALMSSMLLYEAAKKMGIKVIWVAVSRVADRVCFANIDDEFPDVFEAFKNIRLKQRQSSCREQAIAYLKDFREKPATYSTLASYKSPGPLKRFYAAGKMFFKLTLDYFLGKRYLDYAVQAPWNYFRERLLKTFRRWRGYSDIFEDAKEGENFAFYPLHFEPEAFMLVMAPFYTNQINLIKNIAQSLPINMKLYIKEHPDMMNLRPRFFYKEILNIPNVRLIKVSESTFDLTKKAKIILVINSTVGWEAILLKKPVITFGRVFYNILKCVKKSENPEHLPLLIKEQLANFQYDEEELIDYLSALFEESLSFDIWNIWYRMSYREAEEKNVVNDLAQFIFNKIIKPFNEKSGKFYKNEANKYL